jgi:hypothetical protein
LGSQVKVKQYDEDNEDGECVCASKVSVGTDFRLYQEIEPDMLSRVTLRNLSRTRAIFVMPVYVNKKGDEESEDLVEIKTSDCFELSCPFQILKIQGREKTRGPLRTIRTRQS